MPDPLINFLNIAAIDRQRSSSAAGSQLRGNPDTWDIDFKSSYKSREPENLKYDPTAQTLVQRNFDLVSERSSESIVNPVNIVDGQHAVLLIREAPDTSSTTGLRPNYPVAPNTPEASSGAFRPAIGAIKFATDNFLLQSIQEQDSERLAPSYTLRGVVIRTSSKFGRSPRIYGYNGSLVFNDIEKSSFIFMLSAWDQYLRATSCIVDVNGSFASRGTPLVAELLYRDQVRRGYLLSVQYSMSSSFDNTVSFGFQMFITEAFSRGGPNKSEGRS